MLRRSWRRRATPRSRDSARTWSPRPERRPSNFGCFLRGDAQRRGRFDFGAQLFPQARDGVCRTRTGVLRCAAQRRGGRLDLGAELACQGAERTHGAGRPGVDRSQQVLAAPRHQAHETCRLLVEGLRRALADPDDLRRNLIAARTELRHEFRALAVNERADFVDAAGQVVIEAAAALLDRLANGSAALIQIRGKYVERDKNLLLQPRDAITQRAGHFIEVAAERAVDFSRQAGQCLGQRHRARAQCLVDFGRFGVEPARDIAAAFAHDLRDFHGAFGERFAHIAPARLEAQIDTFEELLQGRRNFAQSGAGAVVDRSQIGLEQRCGFRVALRQSLFELGTAGDDGVLDRREHPVEMAGESRRFGVDARRQFIGTPSDRRFEGVQAFVHRTFDALRMRRQRDVNGGVMSDRGGLEFGQTRARGLFETLFMVGKAMVDFSMAARHDAIDRANLFIDMGAKALGVDADPLNRALASFADQALECLELRTELRGLGAERRNEGAAARRERLFERIEPGRQRIVDTVAVDGDCGHSLARDCRKSLVHLGGLFAHPLDQLRVAVALKRSCMAAL